MTRRPIVRIRVEAEAEIDQIAQFLARASVAVALRFYDAVEESCNTLARMPRMGRQRIAQDPALKELRSWSVKGFGNYLIFYLPLKDGIDVVHVVHGSRDLPRVIGVE
jgi:toxin ParE1/3/4